MPSSKDKVILHSDLNNFYAAVECLMNPSLRNVPMAVAGDQKARRGIILAKNGLAKSCGVKTGNPIWKARQLCPDIVLVKPNYDLYYQYSHAVRDLYREYTDQVEPYGPDECWLDVTGSGRLFGDGRAIADSIRARIEEEFGITASIGVSFNKIIAKLGSDMKKPNATTVIDRDNFREKIWPLSVRDMLFVGSATKIKLRNYGIITIGDMARADANLMHRLFGKMGIILWSFANGHDASPVASAEARVLVKSISNGSTTPRDLVSEQNVWITMRALCEGVSARLRECNFYCRTVQVNIRDNKMSSYDRQAKLDMPNRTSKALLEKSFELYKRHHPQNKPIRTISVRARDLILPGYTQIAMTDEYGEITRNESIDQAVDSIRDMYGHSSVYRGVMLTDTALGVLDPNANNIMHPESFF